MRIIPIKLSPLSEKVIRHEHAHKIHDNVLFLDQTDSLYHLITCKPNYQKSFSTLTRSLQFALPNSVAVSANQIGMKLHHLHKLQLCQDILTDSSPIPTFDKIRNWLDRRNITAEDYNFEAALQAIKNYKRNTAKSCRSTVFFVPSNGNILEVENTPLSMDNIDTHIQNFIDNNRPHFTTNAKRPHERLIKQLHVYAYRTFGKMSPKEYALHYHVPERTQRHALRKFQQFLNTAKNLTAF